MSFVNVIKVDSIYYTIFDNRTSCVGNVNLTSKPATAVAEDFKTTELVIPAKVLDNNEYEYEVISVHYHAFYMVSLSSIKLPETIKIIGIGAFDLCSISSNIYLPASLEVIHDWAFSSNRYESINIPATLYFIGNGAFAYNSHLKNINLNEENQHFKVDNSSVLYDYKFQVLYQAPSSLSEYVFPPTVNVIKGGSFCFSKISKLIIPSSVKVLYGSIFDGCYNLKELYIQGNIRFAAGESRAIFHNGFKLDLFLYSGSIPIAYNIFPNGFSSKIVVCKGYQGTKLGNAENIIVSDKCRSVIPFISCQYKNLYFNPSFSHLLIIFVLSRK